MTTRNDLLAKTPPHDIESERCVLGALIVHPRAYEQARQILDASDFYRNDHGAVFHCVGDLLGRGSPHATIATAIVASNIEAPVAVALLVDAACALENVVFHARRIRECSEWRARIVDAQRVQDDVFQQAASRAPTGRLPDVLEIVDNHDLSGMTREAERALLVRRAPVFHQGGQLIRIRRSRSSASLEKLPGPSLRELLSEHASWVRQTQDGPKRVKPPKDVVDGLISRGTWSLREVHTLAEAPCLSVRGRVLARDGWDESGVFVALDPYRKYPSVIESPTHESAKSAMAKLMVPFEEFHFVEDSDLSAAIALVLTLVARPAIEGSVPLFAVRGPVAGSGKGLVVHVASACAFGRQAPVSPPERDPAEERKSLLALGAEGAPLALLDNLEHALGSDVLAAALTAPTFKSRELGKTKMLEVRLPVLAATGNNLQVRGDLARRCLPIDLDPKTERPESLAFKRRQPAWAIKNHPELVTSALTILGAFCAAGRPQTTGVDPWGSFEEWDALVRHCLLWVGLEDPCLGRERLRQDADTGLAELDAALVEWKRVSGTKANGDSWSARDAIDACAEDGALLDALAALSHCEPRKLNSSKLGYHLRSKQRRIVNGLSFESVGRSHGVVRWLVKGERVE